MIDPLPQNYTNFNGMVENLSIHSSFNNRWKAKFMPSLKLKHFEKWPLSRKNGQLLNKQLFNREL